MQPFELPDKHAGAGAIGQSGQLCQSPGRERLASEKQRGFEAGQLVGAVMRSGGGRLIGSLVAGSGQAASERASASSACFKPWRRFPAAGEAATAHTAKRITEPATAKRWASHGVERLKADFR
jgi:hypothetical protein